MKYLHKLRLKKYRQEEASFLIEGRRLIETAIASDWTVEEIYFSRKRLDDVEKSILGQGALSRNIPLFFAGDKEIAALGQTETSQGIMALVRVKHHDPATFDWGGICLSLLTEDLKDPGNLGTIIRAAHGFGVGAIFLTEGCVELFNPKVVRASMGSLFHLPIFSEQAVSTRPEFTAEELIKRLKAEKFEVIACDPRAKIDLHQKRFPERVCLLIGSEPTGVSKDLKRLADASVRISTTISLESLNVASACAIFLYEVRRQRGLLNT